MLSMICMLFICVNVAKNKFSLYLKLLIIVSYILVYKIPYRARASKGILHAYNIYTDTSNS